MRIVISNASGRPIYEQISTQIKQAILAGDLKEGERLPSIRGLARDLRVSVITTTRAYSDLAAEGFVANVQGKGSYVLPRDSDLMREHALREVESHLALAVDTARLTGLPDADVRAALEALLASDDIGGSDRSAASNTATENSDTNGGAR